MKCDELKTVCYIDAYSTMPVYCAKEVDEAIAELKEENERLIRCCKEYDSRMKILENQSFFALKERRRLKRALWLARAERAKATWQKILRDAGIFFAIGKCKEWDFYNTKQKKWQRVETKCAAKAEEYK